MNVRHVVDGTTEGVVSFPFLTFVWIFMMAVIHGVIEVAAKGRVCGNGGRSSTDASTER